MPFALAHPYGTLRKGTKSVLLSELEKFVEVSTVIPQPQPNTKTAHIFDAMVQIQMVRDGKATTFGELANKHYTVITAPLGQGCNRVDVVFDQYNENSFKKW